MNAFSVYYRKMFRLRVAVFAMFEGQFEYEEENAGVLIISPGFVVVRIGVFVTSRVLAWMLLSS
jgi:hypothetical protein